MNRVLRSMTDFIAGIRNLHPLWQLWVLTLVALNFAGPIFFLDQTEAIWILTAGMLGASIGMFLVSIQGFNRLLGIMHIPWIPLVIYLFERFQEIGLNSYFGIWVGMVILFNSISLIIDTIDVSRFLFSEA